MILHSKQLMNMPNQKRLGQCIR